MFNIIIMKYYRHLLFLSCLCVIASCQSITRNRILKQAEPHIAYLNKIDALIAEYGSRDDSSFVAHNGIFDPNFFNILPLLSEDSRHFDEVSAAYRHKDIHPMVDLDSLLWLDCGKRSGEENGSLRFGLDDLDLYRFGFSNIAFQSGDEEKSPDYFLSESEYRDFISKYMNDRYRRSFADYPLYLMERAHKNYSYLAIIHNRYQVAPQMNGEDSFLPGYRAARVSIYKIETGDLIKEFMVYATNSESITRSTSTIKKNGRTYTFKMGDIISDLDSNFREELLFQLKENGFLLIH